uniref:HlyIII-domain-containing protein n=1 Tax=Moniliophthora roreri TaxID=221103 RepID=A0A0W0FRI0_MONRR
MIRRSVKSFSANGQPECKGSASTNAEYASRTITFDELAEWQKDNEFILSGYRRVQNEWKGCLHSIYAYLHNETVNIHSHLWGAIAFCYLLMNAQSIHLRKYPTAWMDFAMFSVFLISAILCLLCSAIFHTSTCHSKEVSSRCHAFDYSGIIILTVGSFYPCLYYGFFCEPFFQVGYITSITLVGLGAAYIVLNPEYAKPTHRGARTKVFIALGLSAIVPVAHWGFIHGGTKMYTEMGFKWLLISGCLYISGALIYANRVPERFYPGRFDLFFASHQIFHVCVIMAALAHYNSILIALEHTYTRSECTLF